MYVDVFLFILYGYDRVSYVCQFFMMGLYLIKLILFLTETEMMIFEVNMVYMHVWHGRKCICTML